MSFGPLRFWQVPIVRCTIVDGHRLVLLPAVSASAVSRTRDETHSLTMVY